MNAKALSFVVVAVLALAFPSIFVVISGNDPARAWLAMLGYAFGTVNGWSEVLVHAIPLTLIGLGVAVAFRAGLFNIGGDGQLLAGAAFAVAIAPLAALLGPAGLPVFLVAGFLGGALLGALVGFLRARFGANEIIVTIMLNYVAFQLVGWLVRGPLQESMGLFPRSDPLPETLHLPVLADTFRLHAGLFIALAAVLVLVVVFKRTVFGFRITVLGEGGDAARYAGFDVPWLTVVVLGVSGGLAGLAGAVEVAGIHQRLEEAFSEGFGLTAIAVALLARLNPLTVPLAAILFGGLSVGAGALQRDMAVPFPLVWILQASVVFAFLAWAAIARRPLSPAAG